MKRFFLKMTGICILAMSVSFCSIDEQITQSLYSGIENKDIPDDENSNQDEDFDFEDSSKYEDDDNEDDEYENDDYENDDNEDDNTEDIDIEDNIIDSNKPEEDLQILEFINSGIISKREINFIFSKSVKIDSISIEPDQEIEKIDEGRIITILFKEDIITDIDFIIELCVEDESGNELNVESPFYIENWDTKIIINEVRTEYSSSVKRTEFIEFKVLKPGNLEGIKVFCVSNEKVPMIYEFPAVNVRLNEYIVLHTRKIEDSCIDELGEDISLSGGTDSCPTARDLWIPENKKLVHKNEVVYILDINDNVLDAVMLTEGANGWNNKAYLKKAAEFLLEQNAWYFAEGLVRGAADALDCSSINTAATKSISRDESKVNTKSSEDWYVTDKGGATPGLPNSKRP